MIIEAKGNFAPRQGQKGEPCGGAKPQEHPAERPPEGRNVLACQNLYCVITTGTLKAKKGIWCPGGALGMMIARGDFYEHNDKFP